MTKKDYITMADRLRVVKHELETHQFETPDSAPREHEALVYLYNRLLDQVCRFFYNDNPAFRVGTFRGYLDGTCGPSGGKVKK